jgi:membrane protein YdbS with pleckstrin-like domain
MPYPHDALAPHEELILDLHPHWWFIAKSGVVLVVAIIAGLFAAVVMKNEALQWLVAVWILVSVVWFLTRFVQWISTHFVLTSDRVMSREGVLAKRGIEIPLERVNTVFFKQGIFERLLGLGDLEIESASKDGAQRFEDVRRPSEIQKEIYIQMENNDNRKVDRMGGVISGAQHPQGAPAAVSIADQINQLAQLRDQGHLTEAEFQAKKAELLNRM